MSEHSSSFYGYMPNGFKTCFVIELSGTPEDFDKVLSYQNSLLAKGLVLDDPRYNKLENGEKREKINGILRRKDQINSDNSTSPTFDLYPDNPALGRRCVIINLDSEDETAEFEKVTGYKVSDFKVYPANQLNRTEDPKDYAEFSKPVKGNVSVVYKDNPAYDPNAAKKKRQHVFVRWEVAQSTPTSPPATPPAVAAASSEPPKPEPARNAELRNEQLTITSIEPRPDSTGWYAYGMFHDGIGSHKVTVNLFLPEDRDKITAQGYEWVTSGAVNWPVTLRIQDNRARIDKVLPKGDSGQSSANSPSSAKLGQPANDPTWFGTHVNECWGMVKQYLLTNLYNKNPYHMKGSMWKHSVSADKEASLPSGDWANRTAGDLIHMLEARHENEQPIAEDIPA